MLHAVVGLAVCEGLNSLMPYIHLCYLKGGLLTADPPTPGPIKCQVLEAVQSACKPAVSSPKTPPCCAQQSDSIVRWLQTHSGTHSRQRLVPTQGTACYAVVYRD